MGNGAVLRAGDLQVMSAGSGLVHSEFNASNDEPCHLLQMWVFPQGKDGQPWYRDRSVDLEARTGRLLQVVGPDEEAETIDQDARFFVSRSLPGQEVQHELAEGRGAWLHVATGSIEVAGKRLEAGDALCVRGAGVLEIKGRAEAEVVLWDVRV